MVIQDVADTTQRNNFVAGLQTHMDNAKVRVDDDPDEFYPGLTQRVSGLVTRSEMALPPISFGSMRPWDIAFTS